MVDEIARYNRERWEELARANVPYSRPMLQLDEASARALVDPEGMIARIEGKDVLCLAGGGGQQSVAFALLGANVTVLDITETQLERDRRAAAHYGLKVATVQGDMRDLSRFGEGAFDVVWHAHSINFVPDASAVFREVARVLRPGGLYCLHCHNPFCHGVNDEDWNGEGYLLKQPYVDGEITGIDMTWTVEDVDGTVRRIQGPREFRHTLGTLVNGMIEQGFTILGVWEVTTSEANPEPGTWEHYKSINPPYLTFWAAR
ncbi:MAG: class I SAM-dependent methyltransferase [Chloroflexi bacterium]|nr:class I SAM-dependent methyltransferase [Chloroflexota bacterium]